MEEERQRWQDTALRLQFLWFDAWVLLPLATFFFHWRMWTLEFAGGSIVFFIGLNMYGLTPVTFWRMIACLMVGRYRPAVEIQKRRRLA